MQTLKVLRVKGTPIYDLFTGEGWYNWTRILKRDMTIKVLAGNPLTPGDLQQCLQLLMK